MHKKTKQTNNRIPEKPDHSLDAKVYVNAVGILETGDVLPVPACVHPGNFQVYLTQKHLSHRSYEQNQFTTGGALHVHQNKPVQSCL